MTDSLLIERIGRVTVLTLNKPEVRNALDSELPKQLREALLTAATDGTRCVVLTGAGGAFSSGADIKKAMSDGWSLEAARETLVGSYHPALKAIRETPFPVIAAVDGYAAGIGCDFALTCDLRLVSERGRFAELFAKVGLIPDGGGTYLLPRLIGLGRAMELMFTGRDVLAEEAVQIGMANAILPTEGFMEAVLEYAQNIAKKSPHALRGGKAAMLAALESSYSDALAREAETQMSIFSQPDGMEGFMAFVQKREPDWQ